MTRVRSMAVACAIAVTAASGAALLSATDAGAALIQTKISLADFKAGRVTVLAATDIAARGLDIAQLPLVVNYDLPLAAENYIHRVGRTGRAGLAGRAISLVSAADRDLLRDIQRLLPAPVEHVRVEGFDVTSATTPVPPPHPPRVQPYANAGRRPRHAPSHTSPRRGRHSRLPASAGRSAPRY